jgi:FixJ family two-component response regulator
LKIAVVDDDPSMQTALRRLLQAEGFETTIFASGSEFLTSLAQELPACLLLDLNMPGMSGLDVLSALRDAGISTRVIIVTSIDDRLLIARALAAGAVACLRKPVSAGLLLFTVRQALAGAGRGGGPT